MRQEALLVFPGVADLAGLLDRYQQHGYRLAMACSDAEEVARLLGVQAARTVRALATAQDADGAGPAIALVVVLPPEDATVLSATRSEANVLTLGTLTIDVPAREVRVGSRRIALTVKEFAILVTLARSPGQVFSRADLVREVWGACPPEDARTIVTHIYQLRKKLDPTAMSRWITTLWGAGYKLERAPVVARAS